MIFAHSLSFFACFQMPYAWLTPIFHAILPVLTGWGETPSGLVIVPVCPAYEAVLLVLAEPGRACDLLPGRLGLALRHGSVIISSPPPYFERSCTLRMTRMDA